MNQKTQSLAGATSPSEPPIRSRRTAFRSGQLLPLGTAIAFVVVLYVSFVFGQRNERMLALVHHGYYPNVEASNELSTLLKGIQRGLYDAVDATDAGALAEVDELYATFQRKLTEAEANPVADRKRLNALRQAMAQYYPFSRLTSLRMIRGDTFASLTPALQAMKSRQLAVDVLLRESLRRDHEAITSAFVTSQRIQQTTMTAMICVVIACIAALLAGFFLHNRLATTQARNEALLRNREELEEQVGLRTHELSTASGELMIARDAAERAAYINDQLSRRNRAILDSAGEGIFGLDERGTATFINPAAARMLGWTVEELLGRNLHELIHCDVASFDPEETCVVCRGSADPCALVDQATEFCKKDGSAVPINYTARAIAGVDGASNGVVVTFRDASARRAIEKMKDEFVSTVSHELRTPLTSIRGALGLLSSGLVDPVGDRHRRLLVIAASNTDRLARLIDDILDLERIGSGKVQPECASVDAYELMRQTVDGIQGMAEQAGVRILAEHVDATLWIDSDRILQTLTNLASNAIKFSPRETTVRLSGSATPEHFIFHVSDQGRGIPRDQLETIFERFKQVDSSDSRDKGGTGLGLAICRSIVHEHGGTIWAESANGSGSTFHFTIPWPQVPAVGLTSMNQRQPTQSQSIVGRSS